MASLTGDIGASVDKVGEPAVALPTPGEVKAATVGDVEDLDDVPDPDEDDLDDLDGRLRPLQQLLTMAADQPKTCSMSFRP